jgi:hypothetical protein
VYTVAAIEKLYTALQSPSLLCIQPPRVRVSKKIIVHVIPPEITQELPTDGTSKKLASNPQILDATLSTKDTCPSSLNEAIQSRKQAAPAQALNIGAK